MFSQIQDGEIERLIYHYCDTVELSSYFPLINKATHSFTKSTKKYKYILQRAPIAKICYSEYLVMLFHLDFNTQILEQIDKNFTEKYRIVNMYFWHLIDQIKTISPDTYLKKLDFYLDNLHCSGKTKLDTSFADKNLLQLIYKIGSYPNCDKHVDYYFKKYLSIPEIRGMVSRYEIAFPIKSTSLIDLHCKRYPNLSDGYIISRVLHKSKDKFSIVLGELYRSYKITNKKEDKINLLFDILIYLVNHLNHSMIIGENVLGMLDNISTLCGDSIDQTQQVLSTFSIIECLLSIYLFDSPIWIINLLQINRNETENVYRCNVRVMCSMLNSSKFYKSYRIRMIECFVVKFNISTTLFSIIVDSIFKIKQWGCGIVCGRSDTVFVADLMLSGGFVNEHLVKNNKLALASIIECIFAPCREMAPITRTKKLYIIKTLCEWYGITLDSNIGKGELWLLNHYWKDDKLFHYLSNRNELIMDSFNKNLLICGYALRCHLRHHLEYNMPIPFHKFLKLISVGADFDLIRKCQDITIDATTPNNLLRCYASTNNIKLIEHYEQTFESIKTNDSLLICYFILKRATESLWRGSVALIEISKNVLVGNMIKKLNIEKLIFLFLWCSFILDHCVLFWSLLRNTELKNLLNNKIGDILTLENLKQIYSENENLNKTLGVTRDYNKTDVKWIYLINMITDGYETCTLKDIIYKLIKDPIDPNEKYVLGGIERNTRSTIHYARLSQRTHGIEPL